MLLIKRRVITPLNEHLNELLTSSINLQADIWSNLSELERFTMTISNTLTVPAVILASITLSLASAHLTQSSVAQLHIQPENGIFQTATSADNQIAQSFNNIYITKISKKEALMLFNTQSNFTAEELDSYKKMIKSHSIPVGINVFDLFTKS